MLDSSVSMKRDINTEALQRITSTYHLVTKRLASNQALSDFSLATILALIHYDRLRGHLDQGMLHFKGLQDLVRHRGGLLQLGNSILQKTLK